MTKAKRIFVSNRLPFNIHAKTGKLQRGSGGLVSALMGVHLNSPFHWLGFEMNSAMAKTLETSSVQVSAHLNLRPVVISADLYNVYYDRFCNDVLWPLFHYESQNVSFQRDAWEAYVLANRKMADAILEIAEGEDSVWIHDFHFTLLPQLLKQARPELRVGFFLHIPFPSYEIFRQLPVREELLRGLTAADLVGFHEHSYLRHFSVTMKAMLGIDSTVYTADVAGQTLRLGVYPVSVDTDELFEKSSSKKILQATAKMREKIRSEYLILGVDRLDYTKGIELKLKGFRRLLQRYPELKGKVNLLQVAVPSRTKVPAYIQLKKEIDRLVGTINGEFGQPGYVPVNYIYNSVSERDLLSLYRRSECILIASKRDGMNLVAMEYVISQDAESTPGSVVLTEFAGAASLLGQALFINPWDEDSIADALYEAYIMPKEHRRERIQTMQATLTKYSATQWAKSFLEDLESPRIMKASHRVPLINIEEPDRSPQVFDKIWNAEKCYLILDYDGTLCPLRVKPSLASLSEPIRQLLLNLQKRLEIYLVSGRPKDFLESQFPDAGFNLAAEHGAFHKLPQGEWRTYITSDVRSWFEEAERVMKDYTERVPFSFVENKEASLAWHFRESPAEFAEYQAKKLDDELQIGLANQPVTVGIGSKIVEAKAIECNKGAFVRRLMEEAPQNSLFVCMGDDVTDEDMFKAIGEEGLSIKIGREQTFANHRLNSQLDVERFLTALEKGFVLGGGVPRISENLLKTRVRLYEQLG